MLWNWYRHRERERRALVHGDKSPEYNIHIIELITKSEIRLMSMPIQWANIYAWYEHKGQDRRIYYTIRLRDIQQWEIGKSTVHHDAQTKNIENDRKYILWFSESISGYHVHTTQYKAYLSFPKVFPRHIQNVHFSFTLASVLYVGLCLSGWPGNKNSYAHIYILLKPHTTHNTLILSAQPEKMVEKTTKITTI